MLRDQPREQVNRVEHFSLVWLNPACRIKLLHPACRIKLLQPNNFWTLITLITRARNSTGNRKTKAIYFWGLQGSRV